MSQRLLDLHAHLISLAHKQGGFLPFDQLMQAALYTPYLGYYTATEPVGSAITGADFTTAPEISPLFGHTLARAMVPCFADGLPMNFLECGAGTGKLAQAILQGLSALGQTVQSYAILELSPTLRSQQQALLVDYPNVVWLDTLPEVGSFKGVVLANELLDALPIQAFVLEKGQVFERGVIWQDNTWQWAQRLASTTDTQAVLADLSTVPDDLITATQISPIRYELERGTQAIAWVASMAACIAQGAMVLIDYGFPRAELYHAQRQGGTLMAHRLHHATPNVLAHIGDADITAHVDFTAIALAAQAQGMVLVGFINQARFLINAGIADLFLSACQSFNSNFNPNTQTHLAQAQAAQALQLLISEAEMGELFKVIALTKNCPTPAGFERGDRSHRLFLKN